MNTQQKAAKVAGIAYLITCIVVVSANFGIHDRLNVAGDAAGTARKILENESLFRLGIVLDLVYCTGIVALIAALYVIFRPVSQHLALLATFLRLVFVVAWFVMTLQLFDVLRLLHAADYLRVFDAGQLQALAKMYLAARFDRYYGGLLFYGLSTTVASYLFYKSRYIPRAFAAIGVAACAWCAVCAFVFLLAPGFSRVVNLWWFDTPMALFEIATSFWLLFKGLRQ